jgi:hypothetical protein
MAGQVRFDVKRAESVTITLNARKMMENDRTRTGFLWLRIGTIREYGNEHSSSTNGREFREYLSDC